VVAVCRGSIACPVAAVKEWLAAANIVEGPVFRQVGKGGRQLPGQLPPQNVALIVKAYAKRLGLDPNAFSGHSLRAGLPHLRGRPGASLFKMMDVSRHKSVDTLRGYVRDADAFRDHAGAGLLDSRIARGTRSARRQVLPSKRPPMAGGHGCGLGPPASTVRLPFFYFCPRASIAASTFGGDIGSSVKRIPMARSIALAMAAIGGQMLTSATPLAPYG
jgi:hypothetical protein